jgi:hypothetical protein
MEYVILKGKGDRLYTVDYYSNIDGTTINYFHNGKYADVILPTNPCDLELFRDSLNEILTEVIEKKRSKKND